MTRKYDRGSIIAVVFAGILISGSLIFAGLQFSKEIPPPPEKEETTASLKISQEDFNTLMDTYFKLKAGEDNNTAVKAPDTPSSVDKPAGKVVPVSLKTDHVRGPKDAQIALIEYSDFECPFCKRFHPTPKQILEAYPDKVNWIWRHFPLNFHDPLATKEAEASECANELGGNEKFWAYTDIVLEKTKSNGRGLEMDELPKMAEEIGLNKSAFQKCLDSGKFTERVKKDIKEGADAGVDGTPGTIILNTKTGEARLISGAYPFEAFKKVIDKMLE